MAGGVGSRFWPLSTQSYPKQFLDILSVGETLIQQTFRRLSLLCPEENIFIVTNKDYFDLCKKFYCFLYQALKIHLLEKYIPI